MCSDASLQPWSGPIGSRRGAVGLRPLSRSPWNLLVRRGPKHSAHGTDDFIKGNPAGYDLKIKERGVGLSGGQRQSINLSRALLHEPNILVLDEPTSSMDSSTEAAILQRLGDYLTDRTMVAVTHRNTLLNLVTRVLVMDQGNIILDKPPSELKK